MLDKLRPWRHYLLLKKLEVEEKSRSGIIIATNRQELTELGEVTHVFGGDRFDDGESRLCINVGDIVLFDRHVAKAAGPDHIFVREDQVIGYIPHE